MSSADAQIPSYVRFAIAGLSGGGASIVSHPFDLIKYRLQLSGKGGLERTHKSTLDVLRHVVTKEGIFGLYTGLSPSILRQLTLTTTRLGLYSAIVDSFTEEDGTPPSALIQVIAGLLSGAIGAIAGNPFDVALVRMSSDGAYPPDQRRNYINVFDAIRRIQKEEGTSALSIGWKPAVIRTMVLNVTQIVLYKNMKVALLKTGYFQDDIPLHFTCSIWTATAASIATAPIDIIKTRLMTIKYSGDVKPEYSNTTDAFRKIIEKEGFFSLWKGLTPTFFRILPHNFMIFLLLEMLTKYYKKIFLGDKSGSGF